MKGRPRTRVTVVGGGIAGLALAGFLDPARFEVTVHEPAPERAGVGTALGMWPSAQRALRRLGASAVLDGAARVGEGAVCDVSGRPLVSLGGADRVLLVRRPALLDALEQAVPGSVHRVRSHVTAADLAEVFARSSADEPDAELLVGADGVHSAVRQRLLGAPAASRLTEVLAVRGLVSALPDVGFGEHWGEGALFGVTPVSPGRLNWFCAYRSELGPRDVDVQLALDDARRRFAAFGPVPRAVLAAASTNDTLAQRISVAPPLRSYVRFGGHGAPPTVLVGDAAHAMMPNLGRGAGEALVDARVLGEALNTRSVPEALRHYNRQRLVPTQLSRAGSSAMAATAMTRRWAAPRDALLRVAGTGLAALHRRPVGA